MFTAQARETLRKRLVRGEELIRLSWKGIRIEAEDDFDSAAKDAISDILTARFGPAGRLVPSGDGDGLKVDLFSDAVEDASAMVEAALQSYFGDAEDYLVVEPVKPKADIDIVVLRDPDFSNEISVFGGDVNEVSIDVGADDLNDPEDFDEWAEGCKSDYDSVSTPEAKALIVDIVQSYADNFGHEAPDWAS